MISQWFFLGVQVALIGGCEPEQYGRDNELQMYRCLTIINWTARMTDSITRNDTRKQRSVGLKHLIDDVGRQSIDAEIIDFILNFFEPKTSVLSTIYSK